MKYRIRRPGLVPSLATLFVVALTLYLGIWQIERLEWKKHLLSTIEAAQSAPPYTLNTLPEGELPQQEWHNVIAQGELLHSKELFATPRYLKGELGYAVITPLALETPQGKRYVLVNRGWVSSQQKDPLQRQAGNLVANVVVEGVIRSTFRHGVFTPANIPAKNLWFWYDLPAMAKALDLPLLPVMIDATALLTEEGEAITKGPTPFPIEITIRNDHKGYAITWFLIGLAAVGVFIAYHTERRN